ncbi:nucleoside-diphosphate-sugar epimerase [Desulfosporosinus acidiphilus SJ4]|uniref:Nucleoside-diphosphate-sugar epimerase n=1 Tax=Desulfosporosinus acidiphilus (strain DSM 22704 / JCM 16185 / SJ4) TaxID=646529 RepID=I4DAA1_DESAJ|nr:NAD-dependent epimerase/dehydratase family protein [Desulfosporosinus acidiphilus]AFM42725.1 nucleoside-diphosphate-sugar epimerase [Desulfosporosinus acidiphilus SJ4]
MKALVTGGAGFIGSWVVEQLLQDGHEVWVLDNLSNGSEDNLNSSVGQSGFKGFVRGDIKDNHVLEQLFANGFAVCYHLAASINVQDSIDDPKTTFDNDVVGTFNVLENCRKHRVKMVFMSTCMVYDRATGAAGIDETSPIKPASPYAGSKIAGENMVLSYFFAYGLPGAVIRPFNTYGPRQKASGEGGVVSIFTNKALRGEPLNIYGSGEQTRDLLYVEDCARFVVAAGLDDSVNGQIINAGLGRDISINDLAVKICGNESQIRHVDHIHPQSEIPKLLCNSQKAKTLLNWEPRVSLEDGLLKIRAWMKGN